MTGDGADIRLANDERSLEWRVSEGLVHYLAAVAEMEARAALIADGQAPELIWLLEHPPLYTAGTSAKAQDLLGEPAFPVYAAARGGQYTYHGPGQRVVYVLLDLNTRGRDVRAFVCRLEAWVIATLAQFGVTAERRAGRVGVWVRRGTREDKIAAVGIRLRRWVSFHGLSINVAPDLTHFAGIVPCGIREHGVTSLADLGVSATMADVDRALAKAFTETFARP